MPDTDLREKLIKAGLPGSWENIITRLYNRKKQHPCGTGINFGGKAKLRMEVAFRTWADHFTVYKNNRVTHTFTLNDDNTMSVESKPALPNFGFFTRNGTPEKKKTYLEKDYPSTHYANLVMRNKAMPKDWPVRYEAIHRWDHQTAKNLFGPADFQFMGEVLWRGYFLQYLNPEKPGTPVNIILLTDPLHSMKGSTIEIEILEDSDTQGIQKILPDLLEDLNDLRIRQPNKPTKK